VTRGSHPCTKVYQLYRLDAIVARRHCERPLFARDSGSRDVVAKERGQISMIGV
jgi:hypothetical protein